MPLLSKASNIVQNIFYLYVVTSFTQNLHSIPVATKCMLLLASLNYGIRFRLQPNVLCQSFCFLSIKLVIARNCCSVASRSPAQRPYRQCRPHTCTWTTRVL